MGRVRAHTRIYSAKLGRPGRAIGLTVAFTAMRLPYGSFRAPRRLTEVAATWTKESA